MWTVIKMIDWDWTIGSFIQVVVFFLWCFNIYMGFTTLNWIYAVNAALFCFWFIFAPWCTSEYSAFLSDPFRYHSTIYAAVQHHRFMNKYNLTPNGEEK
jgi:hypothetical protein